MQCIYCRNQQASVTVACESICLYSNVHRQNQQIISTSWDQQAWTQQCAEPNQQHCSSTHGCSVRGLLGCDTPCSYKSICKLSCPKRVDLSILNGRFQQSRGSKCSIFPRSPLMDHATLLQVLIDGVTRIDRSNKDQVIDEDWGTKPIKWPYKFQSKYEFTHTIVLILFGVLHGTISSYKYCTHLNKFCKETHD